MRTYAAEVRNSTRLRILLLEPHPAFYLLRRILQDSSTNQKYLARFWFGLWGDSNRLATEVRCTSISRWNCDELASKGPHNSNFVWGVQWRQIRHIFYRKTVDNGFVNTICPFYYRNVLQNKQHLRKRGHFYVYSTGYLCRTCTKGINKRDAPPNKSFKGLPMDRQCKVGSICGVVAIRSRMEK